MYSIFQQYFGILKYKNLIRASMTLDENSSKVKMLREKKKKKKNLDKRDQYGQ